MREVEPAAQAGRQIAGEHRQRAGRFQRQCVRRGAPARRGAAAAPLDAVSCAGGVGWHRRRRNRRDRRSSPARRAASARRRRGGRTRRAARPRSPASTAMGALARKCASSRVDAHAHVLGVARLHPHPHLHRAAHRRPRRCRRVSAARRTARGRRRVRPEIDLARARGGIEIGDQIEQRRRRAGQTHPTEHARDRAAVEQAQYRHVEGQAQAALRVLDGQRELADLQRAERAERKRLARFLRRRQVEAVQAPAAVLVDQAQIEAGNAEFGQRAVALEQGIQVEREFGVRNRAGRAGPAVARPMRTSSSASSGPPPTQLPLRWPIVTGRSQARRQPAFDVLRMVAPATASRAGSGRRARRARSPPSSHRQQRETQPVQPRAPGQGHTASAAAPC